MRVVFKEYDGDPKNLIGYQKMTLHMIFDIKMSENFRRKARLVADGHKTNTPSTMTYRSVNSNDSIRICLLIAALNDLDVLSVDIPNAYLTTPNKEKVYCIAGPEFGFGQGKVMIITRALYGLKSAGAAFRYHLAITLDDMNFKPSRTDPDVWM